MDNEANYHQVEPEIFAKDKKAKPFLDKAGESAHGVHGNSKFDSELREKVKAKVEKLTGEPFHEVAPQKDEVVRDSFKTNVARRIGDFF